MKFENSLAFAKRLDRLDSLKSFRSEFHIPKIKGKPAIYLAGNSLGLEPRGVRKYINEELDDWERLGVEGHFHAKRPWLYYHKLSKKGLAKLVGAKPSEVVAMNQLTGNLHLMMTSFYQPTKERFKIIAEAGAFSSDQYVFESQIKLHRLDPKDALIELQPRAGEHTLRTEDILIAIEQHAGHLALVIFGALQYYSGQLFDIGKITSAAHSAGACAGFDLAHAIGNVPLKLHDHEVDFAVWCSYKYLNAGPGAVAGAFVHERHARSTDLPRMAGWWGHDEGQRFRMKKGFSPMPGVDGWQLSNFPVLSGAALLASLELFNKAGMKALRKKSVLLTGYLEFLLHAIDPLEKHFTVITPTDPGQRGSQLSILMKKNGRNIFDKITRLGVVADWREPDVIRSAPIPLYNTFVDVYRFAEIMKECLG
jgi:kynureninase